MKLNIGENIRRLRRAADMTQEQLADKLGVAFQSISRWENGTTYPDIEFLPALAGIFGVTVDELIGCEESLKKEQLEKLSEKLFTLLDNNSQDVEAILSLVREIRRECLASPTLREHYFADMVMGIGSSWCDAFENSPELLAELRMASEEVLAGNASRGAKDNVIRYMAFAEDEDRIEAYLDQNATKWDLSKNSLLYERYLHRNRSDKHNILRQKLLLTTLVDRLFDRRMWRMGDRHMDIRECLYHNNMLLTFLHSLCYVTPNPDHPITGDGSVDVFVAERLNLGVRQACYLSAVGNSEGAFIALEDTVTLLEQLMALEGDAKLKCTSPWLQDIRVGIRTWEYDGRKNISLYPDDDDILSFIGSNWVLHPLTAESGWEWFDPIRSDPRFASYVERVKAAFAPEGATE